MQQLPTEVRALADRSVIVLHAPTLGRGDDDLGARLMGSFLRTLVSVEPKPESMVFYNAAVQLLGRDSPHLDALRALDDAGVDMVACVTCLEHYALVDAMALGFVSNMRDILELTLRADKVITP
jgi:selenium metabolism protein YedF